MVKLHFSFAGTGAVVQLAVPICSAIAAGAIPANVTLMVVTRGEEVVVEVKMSLLRIR
jgi:hypothetical protein